MPECSSRCVDTCTFTGRRECLHDQDRRAVDASHRRAINDGGYLTMVTDTEYPDGTLAPCYALVGDGSATAVSVKRAIELQKIGYPFRAPHPVYPDDFETFFSPDFPVLVGKPKRAI